MNDDVNNCKWLAFVFSLFIMYFPLMAYELFSCIFRVVFTPGSFGAAEFQPRDRVVLAEQLLRYRGEKKQKVKVILTGRLRLPVENWSANKINSRYVILPHGSWNTKKIHLLIWNLLQDQSFNWSLWAIYIFSILQRFGDHICMSAWLFSLNNMLKKYENCRVYISCPLKHWMPRCKSSSLL